MIALATEAMLSAAREVGPPILRGVADCELSEVIEAAIAAMDPERLPEPTMGEKVVELVVEFVADQFDRGEEHQSNEYWQFVRDEIAKIIDAADISLREREAAMRTALEYYAGIGNAVKSLWDGGKLARAALKEGPMK